MTNLKLNEVESTSVSSIDILSQNMAYAIFKNLLGIYYVPCAMMRLIRKKKWTQSGCPQAWNKIYINQTTRDNFII